MSDVWPDVEADSDSRYDKSGEDGIKYHKKPDAICIIYGNSI